MRIETVVVTGRVQGVWFRGWTEGEARRLGLTGWVRNRADGTVEALIGGEEDAVAEMLRLFHEGPQAARVSDVSHAPAEADALEGIHGFSVRR
ncbi:MAG: acylphosphatase [Rhodobacteraceae bacterium]|jgi:acylphosphatase|uniref:Acylphosphatase n=1 Tax=Salipiger profundus TaxID=1229727 RepID=A0A1U7DBU1_9RHOB|nr:MULTISPECIES: acylphosphatase [Salipiger]APX25647.1 acylphosphatase [Salipiger profundus]MAB06329.1 acylphosphatase [Paracoccaceae bacterium]GGA04241.1 acylphosphatase [Salipiger profundus]SFD54192.1 acylphosphatase [Salipiger profundus]